jgi:hypothetical protein
MTISKYEELSSHEIIEIYNEAVALARNNDLLGWRQLLKRFPSWTETTLAKWREQNVSGGFKNYDEVYKSVDDAIAQLSPLFAVALAGVESGQEKFNNQRSLLDDLLNVYGWDHSGLVAIVELPNTLAYVYQGLHGAMCMSTGQYELALVFADTKIKRRYDNDYRMLWELRDIMGWLDTLGGKCTDAWKYLSEGADRWKWLTPIFGSPTQYRESLAAYYMALNIHELAWYLARMPEADSRLRIKADLHVPLCFMQEPKRTLDSAFRLLVRQESSVEAIWNTAGVSRTAMENHWSAWLTICEKWLANVYPNYFRGRRSIGHADLFAALS